MCLQMHLVRQVDEQSGLPAAYSHCQVVQVQLGCLWRELSFAYQKSVVHLCWRGLDLLKLLYKSARDVKHMQDTWQDCPWLQRGS